ncbi:hypothetical protein ZIOFF_053793 [Zingiber officinale]|uniref:Uncharacterized protein n=2 Tax=Zingiber officinale TaxID=94328 RepID=A0A8J5FCT8_ZINOF|nr:hypothetical protein ZIOFF_053793 [Zingiber officinale]
MYKRTLVNPIATPILDFYPFSPPMALQQPSFSNAALPSNPVPPLPSAAVDSSAAADESSNKKRRPPPGPAEVLAHYESQGLSPREASLRAVGELQELLYKYAAKKNRFATDYPRKLDSFNTRLAVLEMKLDAKPGFPESLAIGVAASAFASSVPHVLSGLRSIWDSVRSASGGSPPPS